MIYMALIPFILISIVLHLFGMDYTELKFWSLSVLLTILYVNLIVDDFYDDDGRDYPWRE
jgi:hypothetical protein